MQIDKKNGNVCFNEDQHLYWNNDNGEKYISVTTLIDSYGQPYDEEFWSGYKALEQLLPSEGWKLEKKNLLATHKINEKILSLYDIPKKTYLSLQQDILDEWAENKRASCERGTKIHAMFEAAMYKMGANVSLKRFGIGGKFKCDKGRTELDLENGVYPEYLISRVSDDGVLRLAGQIDLLVKEGNQITIVDYKTNKEIKQKSGYDTRTKSNAKMKYPLNNLEDCNYYHYNLQLSTYAWMVQKLNPEYEIKDLIIVHINHDGKETIYHLDYLKKDVERMLLHYKKSLLHKKQSDKYKRIEY